MRKLVAVVIFLAVVVGLLSVADIYVRHRVERDAAARIEQRVPGTHASVHISSFPFVARLAISGTVPELTADVTGAKVGDLSFADIRIDAHHIQVQRSSLLQGRVVLTGVGVAVFAATVDQTTIDKLLGVPVTLGNGTVGLGGVDAPARLSIDANAVRISVAGLPALRVPIPLLSLLPCLSSATITPGLLRLSCTTTSIPSALVNTAVHDSVTGPARVAGRRS